MNTFTKTLLVTATSGLVFLGGALPAVAGVATSDSATGQAPSIQCGIFTNHDGALV